MTDGHIQEEGKAARVRRHLQENKKTYFISAGASAGALAVGMVLGRRLSPTVIAPVFNNSVAPVMNNIVENTVNNVGPCCKVVKRIEDEKIWEKSIEAARALAEEKHIPLEKAKWLISRNANGAIPDVFGMHYQNIATHTAG